MTTSVIVTAHWRALDREGEDTCRLSRADQGWLLVGHARFRDDLGFAELDYIVRCDERWHTLSADLAGQHDGREVQVRILREGEVWWLNDIEQPDAVGARDIDLSFTPATNLMPLRRLMSSKESSLSITAAWLRYPIAVLNPLEQTYALTDRHGSISYAASQTKFQTEMTVDQSGFVTLYPGHWEGEVTHAG